MLVYCITGANRGLGLEFVRQLSQQISSATIIATTRSKDNDLTDLRAINPRDESTQIHILECDTASLDSITSFATTLSSLLSPQNLKITHLLANAGVNSVSGQTSLTIGPADLHREIDINLIGPAKLVENMVSQSLLASDVRVMNMTSGLGSMTKSLTIEPRKCMTYSITKAALNMLTVHQSADLRMEGRGGLEGAVVICMDPGWVKTRMGGVGAILEPEESIRGMLKVLHGLTGAENGKFFEYSGAEVGW